MNSTKRFYYLILSPNDKLLPCAFGVMIGGHIHVVLILRPDLSYYVCTWISLIH